MFKNNIVRSTGIPVDLPPLLGRVLLLGFSVDLPLRTASPTTWLDL